MASTRGRLTVAWTAIAAAALSVAVVGVHAAIAITTSGSLDAELRSHGAVVSADLRPVEGRIAYRGGDLPHETPGGMLADLAVIGPTGVLLQTPDQPLGEETLRSLAAPTLGTGRPRMVDFDDARQVHRRAYVTPVTSFPEGSAVLVASTVLTDTDAAIARTTTVAALLSLLALVVSTVLVYALIGRVLSPVSQIARLAESLSDRDLHRRVEVQAPDDEVGQLVGTFNRMLARLETSFRTLHSFTADASHELRSPLALMASELEYARARPRPAAEQARILRVLDEEVRHMSEMVERLLMLARLDAGELRPANQELDVTDFVHETAARWQASAEAKGVDLQVRTPASGTVLADPDLTRRILDNLLDNAIRHSPPAGRVRVSARPAARGWLFAVSDEGPGIAGRERDRVFERFARAGDARARDGRGGAGLGLPLSMAFARVQGGHVRLDDSPGWGAVFQVWLPDPALGPQPR